MIDVAPTKTLFILLSALAVPVQSQKISDEQILRAVAQSFRTCSEVSEVQRGGSQFRLILHGNVRTEFDLIDMTIADDRDDKVHLTCHAPGCVSQFIASGGKWHSSNPNSFISLSCPGAGRRITAQLAYFYKKPDSDEDKDEQTSNASGAKWEEIGSVNSKFGPSLVEIDQSSIQSGPTSPTSATTNWERHEKIRSAWIRISFPPFRARGKSMSSAAMHVAVACNMRKSKTDSMIAFAGPHGTGEELESFLDNPNALWTTIASDTPQKLAHNVLCESKP